MRIFLLFIFVVISVPILPGQALAIINAEDLDLTMDDNGMAGKLGISMSGSAGNSDKISGEANGHLIWRHQQHLEMLAGSFSYGKSRGVRDTNKSFVHLRHRYAWTKTWGLEAFAQAQQDEFARLKLRSLIGGGLRWSYLRHDFGTHIGLGSFYERETLRPIANIALTTHVWRGNAYLALRYHFDNRVRVQNTVYYQPAWHDTADYRLLNDAAIYIALGTSLDIKMSFELSQDSRPPIGVQNVDVSYKTGLSFRF